MNFKSFDGQFRETEWERQKRWEKIRRQRAENGQCWQCGKIKIECKCSNMIYDDDGNNESWVLLRREGYED